MNAAAARLAEIVDRQRALAAEQVRLAEEAAALIDQLAGDGEDAAKPDAANILTPNHVTVAQLASQLRTSEKTARAIGVAAGARFQIGGRVLFDLAAVRRHITSANYRVLPCSSLSDDEQIADNSVDDE